MTMTKFDRALREVATEGRALLDDPALRPAFAPEELLQAVLAYPRAGGKMLRPALLTWSCEALGGDRAAALRAGVAVELYHTYTLVHDDVIDRDPVRRGQPSVHALMARVGQEAFGLRDEAPHYGLSMAILAGDCLQTWSIDLLASLETLGVPPELVIRLIRRMQGMTGPAIVEGEVRDIQLPFLPVDEVTEAMILRVILTKTSALFAYCGWAGGVLACGAEDARAHALERFAEHAGVAFQLQDDVLGLIADAATLGKPVGSDLREGKRTLIIALGWARANDAERAQLADVLGNPHAMPDALAGATALLERLGAIDDTRTLATRYLDDALQCLHQIPDNRAKDLLFAFAEIMLSRNK